MSTPSVEPKKTGFIYKTAVEETDESILGKLNAEGVPVVHFSADDWADASKMENDFKSVYPNQETTYLAQNFSQTGQVIIVNGISTAALDSITFLVITLSHIITQTEELPAGDSRKRCAIVLKGWPIDFLGMALESGAEIRFAVEDLA